MSLDLSALSRYQTQRFFQENSPVTQQQCDDFGQELTGQPVTPTASQGGTSYTVETKDRKHIVQFRAPNSPLDMALIQIIENVYEGFTPRHADRGQLGELHVYMMNNVGGKPMYTARTELYADDYRLLRVTIDDYARFFAAPLKNMPGGLSGQDARRLSLQKEYSAQLQQLREGLPQRFHATLDKLIPQLPGILADDWPLVPNHVDLYENNIHVDPATGKLAGICDWRDAEISPFGMSLAGAETMLGRLTTTGDFWKYHPCHEELRDQFWATFYACFGDAFASDEQKRRIEIARLVGLFLANGFYDGKPATEEREYLRFLGAVVLGPSCPE